MSDNKFPNSLGENFKLERYPSTHDPSLKAWDAADELIISNLPADLNGLKILIINDSFGALTISLSDFSPVSYVDSYISSVGISKNSKELIKINNDLSKITGDYDLVLLKLPKNLSFLEDILCLLSTKMKPGAALICGGMIKHMARSCFDLIEKYIGETKTSLAKKKARLIYANKGLEQFKSPYPKKIKVDLWPRELSNHSNLFSRDKLDIGTRFFLENIPTGDFGTILDLGCANGLIGLKAQELNSKASLIFCDESFMATKSAGENFKDSFPEKECLTLWQNCYELPSLPKVDLVLCNPPFHQGNTIGDFIAKQMFKDALQALNENGVIRVIGNRHLGYHAILKRLFGNHKIVNQNKKFVIIECTKKFTP